MLHNNSLLHPFLDDLPLGIEELDVQGRFTMANVAFERMMGYSRDELAGMHVWEIVAPGPGPDSLASYFQHLVRHQPEPTPYFTTNVTRDGRHVDVQVNWNYKRDAEGRLVGFVAVVTDITERRRAEAALEESQRRLVTLMSNLPGMAYRCLNDAHWTMVFVSEGCARLTGYAAEQLLGNRQIAYEDLILSEDRAAVRLGVEEAVAENRQFALTYRIRTASGEERWVWEQGIAVRAEGGDVMALEGFITDITAQKMAETFLRQTRDQLDLRVQERTAELANVNRELQKSEEKYRRLLEVLPDAVVVSDLNGHIVLVSQQAIRQYDAESDEDLLGQKVTDLIVPRDRNRADAALADLMAHGIRRNTEYGLIRKDGTSIPVEISSAMVRDAAGQPTGFVSVVRDITERKQAQEALDRQRQTLWHMVRASDHERQLIAYEIHDGLAQQLAGAIMQFESLDLVHGLANGQAGANYRAAMDLLRQAHVEARRLISGVRPPVLDEAGIETAIAHLVHDLRSRGGPKIEFRSMANLDRLPPVQENALYRMAQESLTNACRYSKSDRVRVTLASDDSAVVLEVRDWGVGFDPATVGQGHFGLEGIRERTRLLGGELTIDSRPGGGTIVRVRLPLAGRIEEAE